MKTTRHHSLVFVCLLTMLFMSFSVEGAKIKITHAHDVSHQQEWTAWLQEAKIKFEAQYPDIEIELLRQSRAEQLEKLVLLYGTEECPDVIEVFPTGHYSLAEAGMFADLNDFVASDPDVLWEDFFPVSVEAATVVTGKHTGERWMLPVSLWVIGAAFNDTHFDESGVLPPSRYNYTWTWDDFAEVSKKLLKLDSSGTVTRYGGSFNHWDVWVHNAGGFIYDRYVMPSQITVDSEPVRTTLGFLQDLYTNQGIITQQGWPENFAREQVSIFLQAGPTVRSILQRIGVNWEWSYGTNPKLVRAGSENLAIGMAISSTSLESEAAWLWVKFLATEAIQENMLVTGRPGAYKPAIMECPAFLEEPMEYVWIELLSSPDCFNRPVVDGQVANAIHAQINAVLSGQQALDVGIAKAQEHASNLLESLVGK
ncbi:MAG: extracellular solute-binding protein [Limnochordia bacterium]|nr:extracellular solute-binding protein [Limnochordia bacterium]MDD4517997.1 extracellular solute-binding protein [Limnochordia bacterium]